MKPSQLKVALAALIACAQPVMIWGPPGVGKSRVVAQAAKAYGGRFIDLRLSLLDAVDAHGLPTIKDGRTKFMPPDFLPREGKGVIFLDEFVQAIPMVQNAFSQLILDRRLGDYVLPDGWRIVAAGNREGDRAATNRMPSHLANRFTHLQFEVDVGDWLEWAQEEGLNPMIVAFIAFRGAELLCKFDPKEKAYPTPRAWEFVNRILSSGLEEGLFEVIAGTVGEAAATEFMGFIRVFREMPDYALVVKKPEATKIPENIAARYAVATMLAQATRAADMGQIMKYVGRMEKEFQILTVNDMTKRNPRLSETASYIGWASKNKDLLLNSTVR